MKNEKITITCLDCNKVVVEINGVMEIKGKPFDWKDGCITLDND